ncbi:MAG TPA: hypothetical protein VFG63_04070 [Nocardioidaceae bacterium]|nr:hypothetical protein [Nocardioidaceae bacterium]
MRASKIASAAALLGGVAWLTEVALVWANGGDHSDGPPGVVHLIGIVVLAIALLAAGYATVATAPVWLRAVVSVAVLLLGWIIYASIDTAARGASDGGGWLGDELGVLICAVVAVVAGGLGLARSRSAPPAPQRAGGHRATR